MTVLTAALLATAGVCDAAPHPAAASAAATDGVKAVRAALATSTDAWNRGDLDAHVAIYADSATGGPPFRTGGRATARANLAPFFNAPRPALRLDSLAVRPLGSDYVLATGRFVLSGRGPERTGWFTEVWARTPAGWRIVHEHST